MESEATIVAIATPVGKGAISVIRLSGGEALAVCDRVFSGKCRPSECHHRSIILGEILDGSGAPIDQVLISVMRGPQSYTGEDVVEITCHGGMVSRLILRRFIEAGARVAEPGEFTKRAFLNGKVDLAQAEAVSELVQAKSEKALRVAYRQLKGELSSKIGKIEEILLNWLTLVEANIDFPEDEVDPVDVAELKEALDDIVVRLEKMLATQKRGKYVKEGIDVVIVGRPNVGKSSIFNRIVGSERVIVSEVPGTTRDVVDKEVAVDGLVLNVHDTAGLLDYDSPLEKEAVERTRATLEESDIVLVVLDASEPLSTTDAELLAEVSSKPGLIALNKVDLDEVAEPGAERQAVRVSALAGWGIDRLVSELRAISEDMVGDLTEETLVNERHIKCLKEAAEAVARTRDAVPLSHPPELIASDLRTALDSLGSITGSRVSEGLLEEIFSRFCIGK